MCVTPYRKTSHKSALTHNKFISIIINTTSAPAPAPLTHRHIHYNSKVLCITKRNSKTTSVPSGFLRFKKPSAGILWCITLLSWSIFWQSQKKKKRLVFREMRLLAFLSCFPRRTAQHMLPEFTTHSFLQILYFFVLFPPQIASSCAISQEINFSYFKHLNTSKWSQRQGQWVPVGGSHRELFICLDFRGIWKEKYLTWKLANTNVMSRVEKSSALSFPLSVEFKETSCIAVTFDINYKN